MIETGSASTSAEAAVDKRPSVVRAEPQRSGAGTFAWIGRRLTFGGRRVTDGAVRLPTVMTFVVAMFAATVALVSFGYVATREWQSGTNLLLERRAIELVKAALSVARTSASASLARRSSSRFVPLRHSRVAT